MSTRDANLYLREVIRISEQMIEVAYQGDACRDDVGCGVVFGSVRDKAYKVRKLAEEELRKHEQLASAGHRPAATSPSTESQPESADHHEPEKENPDR